MAAQDTFESFNASLPQEDRGHLKEFLNAQRQELLAARSEDARVRIVHEHIKQVHAMLHEGS